MQAYKPYKGPSLAPRTQRRRRPQRSHAPAADAQCAVTPQMLQNVEQMLVNEALVARILECEETESALRGSAQKLDALLAQQRMARAIYDNLGHDLRALRIDIARLHASTSVFHARLHGRTEAALARLDRAIDAAGHAGAGFDPVRPVRGLGAALESELTRFRQASGLPCDVSLDLRLREFMLPVERAVALHHALRECLSNVLRHSKASRVSVLLEILDDEVLLNVSDNGIGFDPSRPARPGARGLPAAGERISALGGRLVVASSRSLGTAVTLSVPFV